MDVTSEAINFRLVDFFPSLRSLFHFLPYWMLPSKRKLHDLKELEDRVFFELLDKAKESIANGTANPSSSKQSLFRSNIGSLLRFYLGFIGDMLLDKDSDRLDDRQIANNAAHGFGAAM